MNYHRAQGKSGDNDSPDRSRLLAAIISVAFHAMLLAVCLFAFLSPVGDDEPTQPPSVEDEEPDITFNDVVDFQVGGSYTEPTMLIEPDQPPLLSDGASTAEAPLPQPDPQEIMEKKREEISRRVKFATNTADEKQGDGGNDNTASATPLDINAESTGLDGFSNEGFPSPSGFSTVGTIAVNVTLDASGRVIATTHNASRSYGPVSSNRRAIDACLNKAAQSKFKPLPGTTTGTTGVIFYHFKKKNRIND
ncbi:MAG: hypothetical protein NC082_01705 [Clostridiales bacterium]|nr:hypothetical protein [Clostridiales bacterium]